MNKNLPSGSWLIILCCLFTCPIYSSGKPLGFSGSLGQASSIVALGNVKAPATSSVGHFEVAVVETPITGKITSNTGEALPGVNVLIKGTTNGTASDASGNYSITVPDNNAVLVFSYIGFAPQEVTVGNRTTIDVQLAPDAKSLEEVVVVGYGTQNKATLTGSVAQVAGKEIVKSPSANVTASLQGRLPGLTANQRNGQPGRDDPDILIRGASTLNDNGPLIIVDGVPRSQLSRLNPEDIESISVLKDASAAIYGARGANGVILVTTKSGSKGKPEFSITYRSALARPTKVPDVLDAATFAQVYNEGGFYRAGRNPNYYNNPQYSADAIQKYQNGSDPVLFPNTDWVGEILRPRSSQQNLNLQATGGSDNVRYLLSFGTLEQGTSFRFDPTNYRQYNARVRVDVDLLKNLTVGANLSAILNRRTYSPVLQSDNFINIMQANPTIVGRYPNGLIGPGRLGQNPMLLDQRGYTKIDDNPLYSTFTASYKVPFLEGLKLDGSFNYDLSNQFEKNWELPYFYHEYNTVTNNYDRKQADGRAAASLRNIYRKSATMLYNLRVTYDKTFLTDHHITAMVGSEQQQSNYTDASATRRNFLSTAIDQINAGSSAAEDLGNSGTDTSFAYNNYLGRFNYDFKAKYLLEFLFRYDGSQKFPQGNRYGFFPGISGAWRLSEEDFVRGALPFVNELKLRASYGELGNDRVRAFQYLQFFGFGGNYVFGNTLAPGLTTGVLPNPNITWERAKKTDIGLEATLWEGKLGVDLTLWQQQRRDILIRRNLAIPSTMGFSGVPPENFGKTNSRGLELILSHRNRAGALTYNISGNMAYSVSKVIELDEVPPAEAYQRYTGMPIGSELYYKADGIFNNQEELDQYPHHANTQVGDIRIVDLNNDKVIDSKDQYRFAYTLTPRYVFGLSTDFQYKNFDLNILFQGQSGAYNYDGAAGALGGTDFANALVWRATDRWTVDNPNGTMPRADAWQPGNTTFFLFDASFVRLKSMELGYNIPSALLERTKALNNVRLFASGFNLATWAKEIKWADPELRGNYLAWPPQRIINFGASIKF